MAVKKRTLIILFLAVFLAVDGIWFLTVYVHMRVERGIQGTFKNAQISVGRASIEMRPWALAVPDIHIQGQGYEITVPRTTFDLHHRLTLTSPALTIQNFAPELRGLSIKTTSSDGSKSALCVDTIVLNGLDLTLKLPSLSAEIRGTVEFDVAESQLKAAHLKAALIKSGTLKLKTVALDLPRGSSGKLSIGRLNLEKISASNIQAEVLSEKTGITANLSDGSWVKGRLSGTGHLALRSPNTYDAEILIADLDLDAFTEDLELKKKMSAAGKLTGKIRIEGDATGIRALTGEFASDAAGGDLVIQDVNFLKYLAQNTRQPISLVEAAFKEYHFDAGRVSLGKSGKDLHFSVSLEGAKGKRDFEINLHDQL